LKRKISLLTLFLCLLMIPIFYQNSTTTVISKTDSPITPIIVPNEDPFEIYQNNQFQLYSEPGCDGTELNPWVIRDMIIDTGASRGVWIHDTTDYFLMLNCTISASQYDLWIENIAAGTGIIKNSTFIGGAWGVHILDSAEITIMDCFAYDVVDRAYYAVNASDILIHDNRGYNCDMGIYLTDCYSADMFFNEFYDASYDNGIYVEDSEDIAIQNNIVERSKNHGIYVLNCTSAYVGLNNCTDNGRFGVSVEDSPYSLIEKNKFIDCDLGVYADSVEDLLTYDVYLDNTINDEEIYYSENAYMIDLPGWIQQYPQIILVNASNVNIIGQDAFAPNIYAPLLIQYGQDITIQDCYFENSGFGLSANDCDNVKVFDCSFLEVDGAIGLERTNNSLIQYNTIINATYLGISLEDANFNVIKDNHLENMLIYAVGVSGSNNVIYHNNFINCSTLYSSYGYDTGVSNYWYNETLQEGNWWDNWGGTGTYAIGGSAGAVDLYPLGGIVVIPELGEISSFLFFVSILSFIAIVVLNKRRK